MNFNMLITVNSQVVKALLSKGGIMQFSTMGWLRKPTLLQKKGQKLIMGTTAAAPTVPLTTTQTKILTALGKITPYLSAGEQAVVATAMAFSMPSNPLEEVTNAISGLATAAADI